MNKTRVLVVDDSAFMRQVISDIIDKDQFLTVVGTARNGQDALKKIKILNPDVVTLDIEMPIMDGISTLEQIMRNSPLPVIMLSSLTKEGADTTVKALEKGAVDFITKPAGINLNQLKDELIYKIKMAAKIKMNKHTNEFKTDIVEQFKMNNYKRLDNKDINQIVVLGTSTGGPKALQEVLPKLPDNLPVPILIVQHMPPGFTKSLADRLNSVSKITVKEAQHEEIIESGNAYIAPGDFHLTIKKLNNYLVINLTKDSLVKGHRPSVNVMMESVCENFSGKIIGVIMTGMGNDGTEGMKRIKHRLGENIAEAESTCVVYGMPKAAIQAKCVDVVVPVYEIANNIIKLLKF